MTEPPTDAHTTMTTENVYQRLGVEEVINAAGTKTRIGGSLIRPEAADAMREAANGFAEISELQARASELIRDVTGAEAGYVTSGASAGLTMAAAACIAGDDPEKMRQLPSTDGIPDRIVVPRSHRSSYDHAYRVAGATIADVGANDHRLGTGAENTKLWEIDAAIDEETVAVGYMQKPSTDPPLAEVVEVAHRHDVPVIVDAAAELPPVENLRRFVDAGADLVAFSGGKAIRGPQTTGILAGRKDLIRSTALQHLDMHEHRAIWDPPAGLIDSDAVDGIPGQGVGRGMKVSKEELVGLITALDLFVEEDFAASSRKWRAQAEGIVDDVDSLDCVSTRVDGGDVATVVVTVDGAAAPASATDVVRRLRTGSPPIFVGSDDIERDQFTINPMCLADGEADVLVDRLYEILS